MDLPILGAVADLVGDVKALDPLRALVKDVPIGAGRPLAGTPRTAGDAFRVVDITALTHIDPLSGADAGGGASSPSGTTRSTTWMKVDTPSGGVVVAVQKAPVTMKEPKSIDLVAGDPGRHRRISIATILVFVLPLGFVARSCALSGVARVRQLRAPLLRSRRLRARSHGRAESDDREGDRRVAGAQRGLQEGLA